MKKTLRITPIVALALAMSFGPTGCGHSSSGNSMGSSESVPGFTKEDREGEKAGIAELQRHWLNGPDAWTTAIVSGTPYAPDHFLRQCRALTVDEVKPEDLSESDKLNGFEWTGQLTFKPTSCREGGGQEGLAFNGMSNVVVNKHPGRWSQWVDFTPGRCVFKSRGAVGNSSGTVRICAERYPDSKTLQTQVCGRVN
jgi:hypothetical protein